MRIVLIGGTGQLGSHLLAENTAHELLAPSKQELDVELPATFAPWIADARPDLVINTAAFHDVPRCEVEPERAFRVNCVALRDLATACREAGAQFVTFSSDYVFGGEKTTPYLEDDPPRPLQVYGISRLAGEFAALAAYLERTVVIRTCGLYGLSGAQSKGGNFVDKRIDDARTCSRLEMACEQTVSPTYAGDLAKGLLRLVEAAGLEPGVYHLANEGEVSWYEFTQAIYEELGLRVDVVPVDRQGRTGAMRRPLYSALGNRRARNLGIVLPEWREGLRRYVVAKFGVHG